jgi:uncharacterized protein YsxB (DUF464 family)
LQAGDGRITVRVPARMSAQQSALAQVLLETTLRALQQLQEKYVGFLKIRVLRPC